MHCLSWIDGSVHQLLCSFNCSTKMHTVYSQICGPFLDYETKGHGVVLMFASFMAGDLRGRGGSRCRRREKGILPPDHERAAGSQIWDVSLLRGVQAHLVFKQGTYCIYHLLYAHAAEMSLAIFKCSLKHSQ